MRLIPMAAAALWLCAMPASAQDGLALSPYPPPASADDALALARPETLGLSRLSRRPGLHYAHAPLVLDELERGVAPERVGAVVGQRIGARALFAYGIGDRVEVHAALPLVLSQSGDADVQAAGFTAPSGFSLADPSLGGS